MPTFLALLVLVPGIQSEAIQGWQRVPKLLLKSTTYPPASKNNSGPVVFEFTGTLAKGVFIDSALLPGHSSSDFPNDWFRKTLRSIRVPNQQARLHGRFQLRFSPVGAAIVSPKVAAEPITLWFKK